MSNDGDLRPCSYADTAVRDVPARRDSSSWLSPAARRTPRNNPPSIRARPSPAPATYLIRYHPTPGPVIGGPNLSRADFRHPRAEILAVPLSLASGIGSTLRPWLGRTRAARVNPMRTTPSASLSAAVSRPLFLTPPSVSRTNSPERSAPLNARADTALEFGGDTRHCWADWRARARRTTCFTRRSATKDRLTFSAWLTWRRRAKPSSTVPPPRLRTIVTTTPNTVRLSHLQLQLADEAHRTCNFGSPKTEAREPCHDEDTVVSDSDDGPRPPADGQLSEEQLDSDLADLNGSLAELSSLVSGSKALEDLLAKVATSAVRAVPGADGAGITLLRVDRVDNIVEALAASTQFVSDIDDIQYRVVKEGPCITAALERETVRSGELTTDSRWPRFGPQIGRMGVHSVLSLPLLLPGQVVGAINVYAHAKDVFDEHAAELGEAFAGPAAVAVHNAQVLAAALAVTAQLQIALSSRPIIDQAIGLIRGRSGGSAEEAFGRLRTISQADNIKLTLVAQRIVDEAVRRAHARHLDS